MENKITLDARNSEIFIERLRIPNPDTYNFLKDKENIANWVIKALIIGCVGLRQMVLTENVDFVEKEFNKFIAKAKETFEKQSNNINEKIDSTFSLNNTFIEKAKETFEKQSNSLHEKIDSTFSLNNLDSPLYKMKELIDVYFNKENGQIRGIIDETFNINNRKSALSLLIEELKKNSEMDEAKIQELLDPNRTDSPARQLKDQILNKLHEISDKEIKDMRDQVLTRLSEIRDKEIKDIRDYVLKESAVVAEKQKGTTKGFVFEEEVYRTIQILASHYENTITSIGEVRGTESKKGDLLIELENKKRVVIECKDSASYSSKKTIDEINDAIQNRSASFGIFIFAKRDSMPSELCPIKITDKYVITYYDEDNVYFAYRLARLFALRNREDSGDKIDFEKVSAELNALEESFKAIDSVQSKVTTIINAGEYVRTNLKSLRDDIDDILLKLKRALGERFEAESVTAI